MSIEFKITDNSKEILNAEQTAIKRALTMIGVKAENFAKKDCPVDTGLLRNSITYALSGESPAISSYQSTKKVKVKDKNGNIKEERRKGSYKGTVPDDKNTAVYIGTNVEYAEPVEYGDNKKHTTGKAHFLRDAATTHGNLYKRIVKKALEGTTQ